MVAPNPEVEFVSSRLACATHELIGVIGDRWSVLVVGWPGGVSPPGSHGTVRDSLPSHGSSHPGSR